METVSQNACASGDEKKRGKKRRRNKEKRNKPEPYQYLKVTKKVLKSDEALWALYEKWCEMNQKSPSGGAGLTCWSDLTDVEREKLRCCCVGCLHTYEERQRRLKRGR